MSATARFFTLPLRYLHLHRPSLLFLSSPRLFLSRSPPPRSSLHLPRRFHFNAHAQTQTSADDQFHDYSPSSTSANGAGGFSQWPEWFKLINSLQFSRYFDRMNGNLGFDEFVDDGVSLPEDFVRSVNACLAFAREHGTLLWSLSRKDIETVVENGSPFLFKDSADTMRRMESFLDGSTDHVMGGDKSSTIDVMKFLLSYASTALVSSETIRFQNREFVEGSVRRLFSQLAELSGAPESSIPPSVPKNIPGTEANVQVPRAFEQIIQMKRGDWVCPRCSFMNFARNMKCLECEESRPKRVLTGGEWECPQCDFFNYGKNMACLRCDCKKNSIPNPVAGFGYKNYSKDEYSDKQSTVNQDRVPSWLRKISQLENSSKQGNVSAFEETLLSKEGTISNNNTIDVKINQRFNKILERSTDPSGASSWNANPLGNTSYPEPAESASPPDDFPGNMPMRKGESSFVIRERKDRSLTSPTFKRRIEMEQSKNNNYVPFVPFPPNHFARDQQPVKQEPEVNYDQQQSFDQNRANQQSWNQDYPQQTRTSPSFDDQKPTTQSFDQSTVQPMSNQQRWNQDYPQQTRTSQSFDDQKPTMQSFDQSRLQPMANNERWNQDYPQRTQTSPSFDNQKPTTQSFDQSRVQPMANQQRWNQDYPQQTQTSQSFDDQKPTTQSFDQHRVQPMANQQSWNQDWQVNSSVNYQTPNSQSFDDQKKPIGQWRGSSLEGSAVKEDPDPLDMSEEAKAERWFKRVAQIKDIKELSEIPDEDFPSIMPMRKGVNRFVVSKRKTPLERRLASSQYRRNLPVVKSDPLKNNGDTES